MQSSKLPKGVHGILQHFSSMRDPRVAGRCDYPFETVLVIGLLGVLCGAEGWTELEGFAKAKKKWLRTFLDMPGRPPKEGSSADCSRRFGRRPSRPASGPG